MRDIKFSDIAVVADNAEWAEIICSHFRRRDFYLTLIEAPEPRLEKWGMFLSDYVRIANTLSFLHPKIVLLYIEDKRRHQELLKHMQPAQRQASIDITIVGLDGLHKVEGYRETRRGAMDFVSITPQGHLVAAEQGDGMAAAIGTNLACAESGNICFLPPSSREETDEFWELQHLWMSSQTPSINRQTALERMLAILKGKLGILPYAAVTSFSFISSGLPYGLYPLDVPSTHFLSYPLLGVSIVTGMLKSKRPVLRCPSVFLCDPNECGGTEFNDLRQAFDDAGYILRISYAKAATVRTVRYVSQHLPLDWIFFATHCGEVRGRRLTAQFRTNDGVTHSIVYDSTLSVSPCPRTGLFEVIESKHWVSLDGVTWDDTDGKTRIDAGALIEQYTEFIRKCTHAEKLKSIANTEDAGIVKGSAALKMSDSNYMPAFHNVGGYKAPVVFNNACSSWRGFADAFSYHGASVYVGTGCDVPNTLAVQVARAFARRASRGNPIGTSLYRAQKQFVSDLGFTPYLMHGYLFTKLSPPSGTANNILNFRDEILLQIHGQRRHMSSCTSTEVRRNSEEIIADLTSELQALDMRFGLK